MWYYSEASVHMAYQKIHNNYDLSAYTYVASDKYHKSIVQLVNWLLI